jgi:glycosyltransferase involved in cell wall biosynthesis
MDLALLERWARPGAWMPKGGAWVRAARLRRGMPRPRRGWHVASVLPGEGERPLRIAMIGGRGIPATYGGVERAVEELSAELAARGHRVTVFARRSYSDGRIARHRGVEVVHHREINTKRLEAISHTALALVIALRWRRFDIIHLHGTGPSLLSFVPRLAGVPTVATVQGLDWRREKWGPFARRVLRLGAHASAVFPTRTIVVSRTLERHFREAYGAETVYIPNGVVADGGARTPVAELQPGRFVLFLGRLVPEKHVHTLIEAYRLVDTEMPLAIAGPPSHSPEYLEQLEALAAGDQRVRLLGPRYGAEKAWLMRNAVAFVQPSSVEGLPIALLEALAAGRFPIVSEIAENLEPVTVRGRPLGLHVPVGDSAALGQAISDVFASRDRDAVGEELRAHVLEAYDWGVIAAQTARVYRDALAAAAARGRPLRQVYAG